MSDTNPWPFSRPTPESANGEGEGRVIAASIGQLEDVLAQRGNVALERIATALERLVEVWRPPDRRPGR